MKKLRLKNDLLQTKQRNNVDSLSQFQQNNKFKNQIMRFIAVGHRIFYITSEIKINFMILILGGLACLSVSTSIFIFVVKRPIASGDGTDY